MKRTLSCPSCGVALEVEDAAPGDALACPSCGSTFAVPAVRVARVARPAAAPADVRVRGPVTTQRTSKKWKLLRLVGLLLLGGGIVYGIGHQDDGDAAGVALAIALPGVLLMLVARIGRWWSND